MVLEWSKLLQTTLSRRLDNQTEVTTQKATPSNYRSGDRSQKTLTTTYEAGLLESTTNSLLDIKLAEFATVLDYGRIQNYSKQPNAEVDKLAKETHTMPLESCNPRPPKTESSAKELETKKKTTTQKSWDCNQISWTMIKLLLQNTHTHTKDTGEGVYKASLPKASLCVKESTPHAPFSWSATPASSQLSLSLSLVSL